MVTPISGVTLRLKSVCLPVSVCCNGTTWLTNTVGACVCKTWLTNAMNEKLTTKLTYLG